MKNVFNISPVYSFLDVLGEYVLNSAKEKNLNIANDIILLPTKRACRALKDIFVSLNNGATLLPKICPIGDIDENGIAFLDYENENISDECLLPPINEIERNLILSKLIKQKNQSLNDEQAFALAVDLAHLIDTVEMEMLSFDNLSSIVPEHLSQYWQETLEFLQIITEWYPKILQERGYTNPVARKIKFIYKQVEIWKKFPPKGRIFIAGSTGSLVPIAYMINAISEMENGYVILPHLDKILSDDDFENVGQNHPQYGLKNLLLKMNIKRQDVKELKPSTPINENLFERETLSSYIMLNSSLDANWQTMPNVNANTLNGISKITFKTDLDETLGLALCLREMVEKNKKTLLITPDRKIAKSVASELKRWDIIVDDSAGISASEIDTGNYIILLLNAIIEKFSPFALLSILKHKFTSLGYAKDKLEQIVNNLEENVLRGNFGLDNIDKIISKTEELKIKNDKIEISPILSLLNTLKEQIKIFDNLFEKNEKVSIYNILYTHLQIVEKFVQNDKKEPDFVNNLLYNGDLEFQLCDKLKELLKTLYNLKDDKFDIDKMDLKSYRDFISSYLFNLKLRPTNNSHPLIAIMNSIEARLLNADVFIMAGLNEQTFPSTTSDDPWMSRPMKAEFKLPLPERKIGLSSHDFSEFFCKQNVIMTRALKVDSNNTIESRWLQKLDAILQIKNLKLDDEFSNMVLDWTNNIDKVNDTPVRCVRPAPKPPLEARPKQLSATNIEKLYRDPYIIFAKYILKLSKLKDIEQDTLPADFGNVIHNSLEEFKKKNLSTYEELMQIIMKNALPYKEIDIIDFWYRKFESIAKWFIEYEAKLKKEGVEATYTEISGTMPITKRFNLFAKADRIDILKNSGGAIISDYKTGTAPSVKDVESGYSPQLPLEALILNHHGFKDVKGNPKTSEMRYLEISDGKEKSAIKNIEIDEFLEKTLASLVEIIEKFDNENTPYISRPNPSTIGQAIEEYSDYNHLERVKEWNEQ